MTEDYKEKLIKYMTGNLNSENGTNTPQFLPQTELNSNFVLYLEQQLNTDEIIGFIQPENSEVAIAYGRYKENNIYYGFILIIDDHLNPVQLITTYNSGAKFRPFMALNIDENNSLYGVDADLDDSTGYYYSTNLRFVLLNNVFTSNLNTGTYRVILRNSYYFPNTYQTMYRTNLNETQNLLYKKNDEAKYYFLSEFGTNVESPTCLFEIQINVGSSNEWNRYIFRRNGRDDTNVYIGVPPYIYPVYDSDKKVNLHIGCMYSMNNVDGYSEWTFSESNSTLTFDFSINAPNDRQPTFVRRSFSDTYIAFGNEIYKINYNNKNLSLIYTVTSVNRTYLILKGAMVFLIFRSKGQSGKRQIGMIYDDKVYLQPELIPAASSSFWISTHIFIYQQYNLYRLYVINAYDTQTGTGTSSESIVIFNPNNYNGFPYEAPNCLVPNSGILYDTDNNIIFARNLYNKTVLGATTTSTLQIPNTMLNDVTIGKSDLISETNLPLTEDETDITKNIYETVNINFANSISIRNDNDPNNKILNPTAAARLNGSTTQNNNYDDVKATKVRVNYTDGTNIVIALNPDIQIKMMSKQVARYQFIIYVNKEVENLQIISFDENTIYQTITGLNIEVNKIYRIVQYVSIGQTITSNEVLYNGQNVLYNNEQVNYIT